MESKEKRTTESRKATYMAPAIEIIEVENEGVMAASDGNSVSNIGSGQWGSTTGRSSSRSRSAHQSASPLQDLEDMLNDLFTVKK